MIVPNKIELFQSFCRNYVNRKVREFFRDRGEEIEDNFEELFDKSNSSHVIKALCLHDNNDTIQQTMFAFDFFYQYVNPVPIELDDIIYGIPKREYEEKVKYKPQIFFYFTQDYQERERDKKEKDAKSPVRMEISARVMNPNRYQLQLDPDNNQLLIDLGKDIKRNFKGFTFEKGIFRASYYDPDNGIRFILPYERESDCRNLILKILNSLDIVPNFEKFFKPDGRESDRSGLYEKTTGKVKPQFIEKELMLGERKNQIMDRAIGTVFLYRAVLQVYQREPVTLCHHKKGKGLVEL